ncbi:MAG: hypothetical protein GY873_20545 [Bosea sp.]|uniref:hypothetical protein n=1 Tax=Bosea sp. (in: a-proteobacteria) TaxID=1871050 RepID=UPI002393F0AE|nr:hypothetical protein [Bosea sp. (in: a-proteobacteria)]MCP4736577.1 hypothetical protein [Bosea sp. (in: a-proteobacteria)]
MYFDDNELQRFGAVDAINFGVGFAFFRSGERTFSSDELSGVFDGKIAPQPVGLDAAFVLQTFLEGLFFGNDDIDRALMVRRSADFLPFSRFFGSNTIIVENSPPAELDWRTLTKTASAVTIGTYIGFQIAPSGSPLLLISVPIGIIAVGTAIGISRGLENGLNKSIEKLINKLLL